MRTGGYGGRARGKGQIGDRLIIENLLPLHDAGLHCKFFKGMISWLDTRYSGTAKGKRKAFT